ncbi:MAG TPA: PD-(D/E)XK nuclease family protein [Verrucomicrobiota bacterium]|nr:PD-(D/E)XK nuclease family protein [Verrucomicrobiota bacterium]HNU51266.1 PD-(D/E)XK nuclease family protein [Verrucomicrobiota bacterium]
MAGFLCRLGTFQAQRRAEQRRGLDRQLRHIRSQLPLFRQQRRAYEARVAPRFNVFRVLRLERKEVLVHTPMLAELLDPQGAHGQGFLFLGSFLEMLRSLAPKPLPSTHEGHQWFVETEKPTGSHGNLDVLITSPTLGCLLAIENKVGAGEQREQLYRYWCWLRKQRRRLPHQILIFLTPEGREAETARSAKYTRLSYHTDICPWLQAVLPRVKSPAVSETVGQYVRICEDS